MIKHLHLDECDSTQDVLKEQLKCHSSNETFLVSCEHQKSGRGRGENKWLSMPGTLCFSLNLLPHKIMSFTAIELSVIVARFFEERGTKVFLKWPNDVWNKEQKKCAGILVQGSNSQLLAGIGVNLFSESEDYGGIFDEFFSVDKKKMVQELAEFILLHRYEDSELLKRDWLLRCGHLNQIVRITENDEATEGVFQGLGEHGEAIVCEDGRIKHLYNGSLRLITR